MVTRYRMYHDWCATCFCEMDTTEHGEWVEYEEYEKLEQQLKKEQENV